MFAELLALCGPGHALGSGGLLGGLFLAGMAGSALHCAPMCGGFVLGQVSDRLARLPASQLCEWRRPSAGALLPYHLGRLTTYAALGAVSGASVGVLAGAGWLGGISAALLALAGSSFLLQAAARLAPGLGWAAVAPPAWSRALAPLLRLARRGGGYPLGLALGLLPCGLLYGALFAAASAGGALAGAACMLAFGLGTVPALVVVGVAGQAAGRRWRGASATAAPVIFGASAILLLGLAWEQAARLL